MGHGRWPRGQRRLVELAGTTPSEWGLLFVLDGRQRRWTLYSPDSDYTGMFAPIAHTLDVDFTLFATKFPGWNQDWAIPHP
ncbi:hypothetical protein AB0H34_02965 [Saccharopolyspora shandongensis]|uniref:hypothetical protein n=1 Tax=Saccharopolyspora shandongensis TaxID=418495 RepID=UPI0034000CDA